MKKQIIFSISILLFGCSNSLTPLSVDDFDSCVVAGNAVMESSPEQCRHEGKTYVNKKQEIEKVELANPASTFCIKKGGALEIRDEVKGQVGYCHLADGTEIEEWKFFRENNVKEEARSQIPEGCEAWFDGCNNCIVGENGMLACTRKMCFPGGEKEPKCIKFKGEE